jgi:general secretion pathway protein L
MQGAVMDAARLLNADMRTLAEAASQAAEWWWEEMRGMVPVLRRLRRRDRPRLIVRHDEARDCYGYSWVTGGVLSQAEPLSAARAATADLCLPRRLGLVRTIALPPLSSADLRRLVVLEIDRLTPFTPDQVLIDTAVMSRAPGGVTVAVGVVRREDAAAALDHARARGVTVAGLAVEDAAGLPRFDFLAAVTDGRRRQRWSTRRVWGIALALAVANLLIFTVRDLTAIEALRAQVEAAQPLIQVAEKMREMTEAEVARRAALLARKQAGDPLPVLDSLTRTLPDTVWVQRLEWDGDRLRIVGWSRGEQDVLALIEADPLVADARAETPAAAPRPPFQPFDIVAHRDKGDGP